MAQIDGRVIFYTLLFDLCQWSLNDMSIREYAI